MFQKMFGPYHSIKIYWVAWIKYISKFSCIKEYIVHSTDEEYTSLDFYGNEDRNGNFINVDTVSVEVLQTET